MSHAKLDLETIRAMTRAQYALRLEPQLVAPQLNVAYKFHLIDSPINASDLIVR